MSLVHHLTFTGHVAAGAKPEIHSGWAVKGSETLVNAREKPGNFIPIILFVP